MKTETGITNTVKSYFSQHTIQDIIETIGKIKTDTLLDWLAYKKIKPEKTLIIGAYLTGAMIANKFKKYNVTIVDKHPHLKCLIDTNVTFKKPEAIRGSWDLVVDTTGIGGIKPEKLKIKTKTFIVESPISDASDTIIKNHDETKKRIKAVKAPVKGILYTSGLNTKTSGTMTLTIEVLRRSLEEILKADGVLYASSQLRFYERILFKEKDCEKFKESLKENAIIASSLKKIDCDMPIKGNLRRIKSEIKEV
ncbi:SAM-dependent methyltransferase HcgC family protein [Methanothermobacter tenebrarum]